MSVFRVNKTKDYVTMSKYHFKEKRMSLKAKGLLSEMLSLPDEWDYSVKGLEQINKENKDTIISILKELEEFGYLERTQLRDTKGTFTGYEYNVYEKPNTKYPYTENSDTEKPYTENPPQLNNKELNTNKLNNKEYKRFVKPTLEQIKEYCLERNNNVDSERFFNYYEANGWVQGKSRKPIKDWKACIRTWEQTDKKQDNPSWFNQDIAKEEMSEYELEQLRKELNL